MIHEAKNSTTKPCQYKHRNILKAAASIMPPPDPLLLLTQVAPQYDQVQNAPRRLRGHQDIQCPRGRSSTIED